MTNDYWASFHVLIDHLYIFFGEMSKFFVHFLKIFVWFLFIRMKKYQIFVCKRHPSNEII